MTTSTSISILYVISSLGRGGTENHLNKVLPPLKKMGFDTRIFTINHPGELAGSLQEEGVTVIPPWISATGSRWKRFPLIKHALVLISALQYWSILVRFQPDIVHFFLPRGYLFGAPLSLPFRKIKRVMSRRSLNNYQKNYPPFIAALESWLHKRMDLILGNSNAVLQQLIHEETAPQDRTKLLYNGVAVPEAAAGLDKASQRSKLGLINGELVFCIVANLIPYKGHMDLINALGMIRDRINGPWHLLLIGQDHGIGADIRLKAKQLDIDGNISLMGSRTDVDRLLALSDIGILCSHEEGFSNAVLESMASGLPMVVTDVGGNAEAVREGINGYVVPPKSPSDLAEKLLLLANDREKRETFGRENRLTVQSRFSIDSCAKNYSDAYRMLLERS